ncbi:MAG: transcriptional regulator [Phycisphaerae bacterium]|nr:transcriptional regulator [Phycisphaerae bacterium]
MDETTFQEKMTEIMNRIRDLPESERERATSTADGVSERRDKITKSVAELQESLDYLRLSVKYLIFDLEATRRENAYLRKMIEQSNRDADRRRGDARTEEENDEID